MLREMLQTDLDEVVYIDSLCFPIPWNKQQYTYELDDNAYASLYVLLDGNTLIGYIDFWITFEICQLAKIAIHPDYRGKHHANELMEAMIKEAQQKKCENISLEVRSSNMVALGLYKAYDFIKVNVRKQYYQDNGEDALVLVKALGGYCE